MADDDVTNRVQVVLTRVATDFGTGDQVAVSLSAAVRALDAAGLLARPVAPAPVDEAAVPEMWWSAEHGLIRRDMRGTWRRQGEHAWVSLRHDGLPDEMPADAVRLVAEASAQPAPAPAPVDDVRLGAVVMAGVIVGVGGEHDPCVTQEQADRATRLIMRGLREGGYLRTDAVAAVRGVAVAALRGEAT